MRRLLALVICSALTLSACDSGSDESLLKGDYEALDRVALTHFDYIRVDSGTLLESGTVSEIIVNPSCVYVRTYSAQLSVTDLIRYNNGRTDNVLRFETDRPRISITYGDSEIARAIETEEDLDAILAMPRC